MVGETYYKKYALGTTGPQDDTIKITSKQLEHAIVYASDNWRKVDSNISEIIQYMGRNGLLIQGVEDIIEVHSISDMRLTLSVQELDLPLEKKM